MRINLNVLNTDNIITLPQLFWNMKVLYRLYRFILDKEKTIPHNSVEEKFKSRNSF